MADFLQALDPAKLVLAETALSFVISPFTAPPYNLAIFLFGIYAQEHAEGIQSLQTFTSLVGISAVFDIVWMTRHEQNGFVRFFSILILVLKIPTFFAFGIALRSRGGQFGALNIRGGDTNSATVWSMPGAFSTGSRDGYQNVDVERGQDTPKPPLSKPSIPASHPTPPGEPGPYQSV